MNEHTVPFPPSEGQPRRRQVLAVLCLALLIVVIDNTILNTALPTLATSLHATTTDLQWITDAYTLTFAALLIVAGALGDRYGRRGALLGGLALFGAGSAGAALSHDVTSLIAFRAVMGVGGAFVMPATLSILTDVFPRRERAKAIAAWSSVAGVGVVVGPALGGLLLDHFSWHSVFWVNVPLVLIALVAVIAVVPALSVHHSRGSRLDLAGAVLSGLAMLATIDAVIEGPNNGWLSARTLGELVIAVGLFTVFVTRELRIPDPLIDVRVFRHRAFSAATASVGLTFFALFGSLFVLTQYLQLVHGYSPLSAGLRAMPFAVAVLIASPLSSGFVLRLGVRVVIPAGLLLMATGLLVLTSATPASGLWHVSIGVALMGAGMGLVVAPAGESLMTVLPQAQTGVGSAVNDTIQELGGSLGVAVVGSLVSAAYGHHIVATSHDAFTAAMSQGFIVAASVAVLGAIIVAAALPARARSAAVAAATTTDNGSSATVAVTAA